MWELWEALRAYDATFAPVDVSLAFLNFLIPAGIALGSAIFGKKGAQSARNAASQRAGGATLAQLLPQIMQMMQASQQNAQQQAQQNYAYGLRQYEANLPLQDSLRRMAMGMLPANYTRGIQPSVPLSSLPRPVATPPPAPVPQFQNRGTPTRRNPARA